VLIQDLHAGRGVGLIDPHGDLAAEILEHVPPSRTDDVVYFNPADLDHPIGLNLFAASDADGRHRVASGIVTAFKSIWRDSWGPRLEYILHAAAAALLECQNTSLLGLPRMLVDADYRAWVLRQVREPPDNPHTQHVILARRFRANRFPEAFPRVGKTGGNL
jgi:hypothetical protein